MNSFPGDFVWDVNEAGYRVKSEEDALEAIPGKSYRAYSPREDEPTLFLSFALTLPEPASIRRFAERYGLLGLHAIQGGLPFDESPLSGIGLGGTVEPLTIWKREISRMAKLVFAWLVIRLRSGQREQYGPSRSPLTPTMRNRICTSTPSNWMEHFLQILYHLHFKNSVEGSWRSWIECFMTSEHDPEPTVLSNEEVEKYLRCEENPFPRVQSRVLPDECLEDLDKLLAGQEPDFSAAWFAYKSPEEKAEFSTFYQKRSDPGTRVCDAAAIVLHCCLNHYLAHLARPQLRVDNRLDQLLPTLATKSLLGCLWVQLSKAVVGFKNYRCCKDADCGRWFESSQDVESTKHQFCSSACRLRTHRKKQAMALDMRKNGKSPAEISAQLDTDEDRIRQWLGEAGLL